MSALEDLISILAVDGNDFIKRRLPELCFVGAVSYFEAFCKDHFSSILNIAPHLISKLSQAGIETRIDPMFLLEARSGLRNKIGFLVTERLDMGTADQVNKLYGHILKITPFSKEDRSRFAGVLRDRNLLVHHGGVYTSAYVKQSELPLVSLSRSMPFYDSKVVSKQEVVDLTDFLREIAIKMAKSSKAALQLMMREAGDVESSIEQALDFLDYMLE